MFTAVGRRYTAKAVAEPAWYTKSTWTPKQERKFRDWLVRETIRHWPALTKYAAEREASNFLLNFGWSTTPPAKKAKK